MRLFSRVSLVAAIAVGVVAACGRPDAEVEHVRGDAAVGVAVAAPVPVLVGDGTRGRELMDQFECGRCHSVPYIASFDRSLQCVQCHADINAGKATATPEQMARWHPKVTELGDVPSLTAVGIRYRQSWIQRFLLHPHDLRPALQPTMPRLSLTPQQAVDIAAYLSPITDGPPGEVATALAAADADKGRALLDSKGCGVCHRMSGAPAIAPSALPGGVQVKDLARALRLAPDLRVVRERWRPDLLVKWLMHPTFVKPDTPMPDLELSEAEATNIAAYLLTAPLGAGEKKPIPPRLPVLARKVTYDEVASHVLHKTCWHCHGEPDFERGNGGPGNSGGFGFKGRKLSFGDYESTFAGYLDESGQRRSVFALEPDGTPRIVAAMLARQHEEAGEEPEIRGMPLGFPSVTPEDVQLVETWIAQGRPR